MERRRLMGLTAVMVVYLCVGAAVFNSLEANNEKARKADLERDIDRFLGNNSCVGRQALYALLFKASQDGELVYYILHNKTHLDRWDFSGAFGFSISVVTTIGFGNLAPHTMEGKVVVVIYALMGIPLMLLLLAGIGEKLMVLFKRMSRFNVCHTKPQVNRVINGSLIVVLGLVVGFIAPATLFHYIEDWHFLEALYFCFTTLSTIGFGDYIIGIHEKKISEGALHETYEVAAYVWILFGLAYVSLAIKYLSDLLLSKASKMEQKTVRKLEVTDRTLHVVPFCWGWVSGHSAVSETSNNSSRGDTDTSPPCKSTASSSSSSSSPDLSTTSSSRCILTEVEEPSPPTYSLQVRKRGQYGSMESTGSERNGNTVYLGIGNNAGGSSSSSSGVELLRVNHI